VDKFNDTYAISETQKAEITTLKAQLERAKKRAEKQAGEEQASPPPPPQPEPESVTPNPGFATTVWVALRDNDEEDYLVFEKQDDAESYRVSYDDSIDENGACVVRPEPASNFDFTGSILNDNGVWEDDREAPPKRVGSRAAAEPPEPIKPETVTPEPAAPEPAPGPRGRHFGAYPDPQTMQRIRALTAQRQLDNTALLRSLIEYEYSNPPDVLPPRRKRANRIHHFGCYPDAETWTKIRQLLGRYRIDNTELLSYLVEKNH
jgi:hypothetical protein